MKRVALVTGGNRGIGYELVKQLAEGGFQVILTSRDAKKGYEAAQKLRESGLDVSFEELDVANQESVRQAAAAVQEQYGRLDVLINNAGVYLDEHEGLLAMDPAILEETMAVNFFGACYVTRFFMPLMEKRGYGRVIHISSEYGAMREMAEPGAGAYKLSKLVLNGFTQLAAAEAKGDIKINAADPGWVSTDMGGPSAPRTPRRPSFGWRRLDRMDRMAGSSGMGSELITCKQPECGFGLQTDRHFWLKAIFNPMSVKRDPCMTLIFLDSDGLFRRKSPTFPANMLIRLKMIKVWMRNRMPKTSICTDTLPFP